MVTRLACATQEDLDNDPYMYHGNTRANVAKECVDSTDWLVNNMHQMKFPFLTFHSSNDSMTDPEGSAMLYARSKATDKTLISLDDMWHVLTREDGNLGVLRKIVDWTNQRAEQYWNARTKK